MTSNFLWRDFLQIFKVVYEGHFEFVKYGLAVIFQLADNMNTSHKKQKHFILLFRYNILFLYVIIPRNFYLNATKFYPKLQLKKKQSCTEMLAYCISQIMNQCNQIQFHRYRNLIFRIFSLRYPTIKDISVQNSANKTQVHAMLDPKRLVTLKGFEHLL